jgi:O-antigen ligase
MRLQEAVQRSVRFRQILGLTCVNSLMALCLLAPGITLSANLPRLKAELLFLPVIALGYGWFLITGRVRLLTMNRMFWVALSFCTCVILSMWYGSVVLGHGIILRDYYEIPKVWLPVAFFAIAYEAELSESSIRRTLQFLSIVLTVVCLFAWAQFMRLGFAPRLSEIYTAGEHVEYSLKVLNRVYSTMGNPNVLGQLMDFGIVIFLLAFVFQLGSTTRNALVLFMCSVTLAMTSSRYGALVALFALAMVLGLAFHASRNKAIRLIVLSCCLPFFFLSFQVVQSRTFGVQARFEELKHPLQVDSVRVRLDTVWSDALGYIAASPWIGHGPAKETFTDVITDSEYLDVLKQFGFLGLLPYLGYYLLPLWILYKGLVSASRAGPPVEDRYPAMLLTARAAFVMVLCALAMNVGETTFYNPLLQGFLWMWMGLGVRSAGGLQRLSRFRKPQRAWSRLASSGWSARRPDPASAMR